MDENEININDDMLYIKKKNINSKEEEIIKSQIIQNRLEDKIRKLEIKKENIIKGNKWVLSNIIYTKIYDAIMATILILIIISIVNNYNLMTSVYEKIHVIGVAFGVLTISLISAYISANIRDKLMCCFNRKRVEKISSRIKYKEILLGIELHKQESLKREITNIMNVLDSDLETKIIEIKQDQTYYDNENIINEYNKINKKNVKKRIKKRLLINFLL